MNPRILLRIVLLATVILLAGCEAVTVETVHAPLPTRGINSGEGESRVLVPPVADAPRERDIFIFFDGTGNNNYVKGDETDVLDLHHAIASFAATDPKIMSLYLEGVGGEPWEFLGKAIGMGMEHRLKMAYCFLCQNYRPGSRVYLFGFSRGAHEARAFAGILAYAGIPVSDDPNKGFSEWFAEAGLEIEGLYGYRDEAPRWKNARAEWRPGMPPFLGATRLGTRYQAVPVTFLGVWDTVPGSLFVAYGTYKEKHTEAEALLGDRYKTLSYANIGAIAHAMSLDEKRSHFRPILVAPADVPALTRVDERWFPGAHADIGGGYEDSEQCGPGLPGLTYNWMLDELAPYYPPARGIIRRSAGPLGLAHYSIGDFPNNADSTYQDREGYLPADVAAARVIDPSAGLRAAEPAVPLRVQVGNPADPNHPVYTVEQLKYPVARGAVKVPVAPKKPWWSFL